MIMYKHFFLVARFTFATASSNVRRLGVGRSSTPRCPCPTTCSVTTRTAAPSAAASAPRPSATASTWLRTRTSTQDTSPTSVNSAARPSLRKTHWTFIWRNTPRREQWCREGRLLKKKKIIHTGQEKTDSIRFCSENIHRGHKPYKCRLCSAAFAQKNSLDVHMKKHAKEGASG